MRYGSLRFELVEKRLQVSGSDGARAHSLPAALIVVVVVVVDWYSQSNPKVSAVSQ